MPDFYYLLQNDHLCSFEYSQEADIRFFKLKIKLDHFWSFEHVKTKDIGLYADDEAVKEREMIKARDVWAGKVGSLEFPCLVVARNGE